jgi:type 1 fimbria pilin
MQVEAGARPKYFRGRVVAGAKSERTASKDDVRAKPQEVTSEDTVSVDSGEVPTGNFRGRAEKRAQRAALRSGSE